MKRVVVTGASGFVGRAVIAPLLALGHEVHLLGRAVAAEGAQAHACDLLADDVAPLLAAIAPTHLLHLAWDARPGLFWNAPENVDWLAATLRLARGFAAAGGARFVGAGTGAEYDWTQPLGPEGATRLAPATLYGTAKAAAFTTLAAAAPALGLSFAWGRIFFPYGAGEKPGRLLPDVIDAVLAGRRVACSDGSQRRDFMHVEDVAAAMVALLDSDVTGPVNIATGAVLPLRDIVGMAAALAGDASLIDWGSRPRQPGEPDELAPPISRLSNEVGFKPGWMLGSGLAAMVAERRLSATRASHTARIRAVPKSEGQ